MMRDAAPRTGTRPLWLLLAGAVALPFIEFVVFFQIADRIGLVPALIALIGLSVMGVILIRREGDAAMRRVAEAFRRGEAPDGPARDAFRAALGGVLMILPGFVSGLAGLFLMLPSLLRGLREGRRPRTSARVRVVDLEAGEWRVEERRIERE